MTAVSFVTLWCDFELGACGESIETGTTLIRDARVNAFSQGWTYKDYRDLCPAHSETSV